MAADTSAPPEEHAGVVDEIARRQAIAAIEHQVVPGDELHHVGGLQFHRVRDDPDLRIQRGEALASGLGLGAREGAGVEQHLALQVGQLDAIAVEQAERAAAGRRQVQRRRRAEAAGAHHQHPRRLEPLLAGGADLGERQVALIALALVLR